LTLDIGDTYAPFESAALSVRAAIDGEEGDCVMSHVRRVETGLMKDKSEIKLTLNRAGCEMLDEQDFENADEDHNAAKEDVGDCLVRHAWVCRGCLAVIVGGSM
jgi:hypothetical protein